MVIRLVDIGGMFEHHCLHNDIINFHFTYTVVLKTLWGPFVW
jgi:hypothetical protein